MQRHFNARDACPDTGVLGDVASVILRHVEVGADKNTLAGNLALGAKVGKTNDVHGDTLWIYDV
jgi:hypothetical protein